ncbi:MAG: class I SAM-dependent RNA methyltransferase [Lachnospiraceae bacterium]|nr:class I SAM-dependent RNA methyltransferase [Lachnospiraceae bacterium]
MQEYEWIAPCHFGTEAVCKREIIKLGYKITEVEDGKVTFSGGIDAMCRANMFLRTAERILLKIASFEAVTYDELFEKTKSIPWEEFLPRQGRFWVKKANSVKSKLFSPSDIQSIMKKAMVERMKLHYHVSWFPEDGEDYPLRVTIIKDKVTIGLDTTGTSLHKRGYRKWTVKAPVTETLAAALIMLTPWKWDRYLIDPFCGSGTIPIEAAMIGANIAPGMNRDFLSENWTGIRTGFAYKRALEEARDVIKRDNPCVIQGYDIDGECIRMAMANAKLAGVDDCIHFQRKPLRELSSHKKYGFIITNPPYGERLEDIDGVKKIYSEMGEVFCNFETWSKYIITAFDGAERCIGKKADKNRKLYNGMIKTYFLQYIGPKPVNNRS